MEYDLYILRIAVWLYLSLACLEEAWLLYSLRDQTKRYRRNRHSDINFSGHKWTLLPLYKLYLFTWTAVVIMGGVIAVMTLLLSTAVCTCQCMYK